MARQKKTIETPGQETTQPQDATGAALNAETTEPKVQQNVATLLGATALAERNAILATLNAQGATIVARFEELGFTDLTDQNLTDNLEFLTLVRKATEVTTGGAGEMVTNEEGKPQPVRGAPVLTEHGWHVPG
ncbi:hypothetical protein ABJK98_06280 [Klebsiella pneumoniae]|uniref:hypothetical protein n=1 Tax=Enterobacteriaceae TaxID=543 RepID=UPI0009533244|nr:MULTISPECIES: hypothetical protein [Enterobacteriaceae]AUN63605.1 hypothetical protein C0074_19130 [Klebsiella pneumoniae]AUY67073.1 hypothetical protein BKY56_021025 [Klebsiella pneumoniae]MCY0555331.1 hypothetical protein [Klebsiella pneumoniae]MDG0513956.1 hypothetical protein [Klebsiella pneumoniae]MEA4484491.1 hypothetical protein [Klebsiella pneumoniae]